MVTLLLCRCLVVEPDTVTSGPHKFSVLEASLRSGGSGSQEVGSESGPQSPSPSSLDCESEQAGVEDLSLRRHNNNNGKSVGRPESPSRPSKRARLTREAPEPSSPSPTFSFQVTTQHTTAFQYFNCLTPGERDGQ